MFNRQNPHQRTQTTMRELVKEQIKSKRCARTVFRMVGRFYPFLGARGKNAPRFLYVEPLRKSQCKSDCKLTDKAD